MQFDNSISNPIKVEIKRQLNILASGNQGESIMVSLVPNSYTLRYKKDSYTLEEAKTELEKKDISNEEFLVTMDGEKGQIPCKKYTTYLVQSQCVAARASLREVQTALAAHQIDTGIFPENLDPIKEKYLQKFPQAFADNFSYKTIASNSNRMADYEIRYIGHIGEGVTGSGETE